MRIAFLAPEFIPAWGGVGTYAVNLVKELCKNKDLEIHVITPKRGNYDSKYIEKEFDNQIKVHQISTANDTFFYNFKFQLAILRKFDGLNKKYKFDLVHSANLVHMPDIFLKFKNYNVPFVTTAHTTIKSQVLGSIRSTKNILKMSLSEQMSIIIYPYIKILENFYLRRSKNIITVSKKYQLELKKLYKNLKIDLVYNGVDKDVYNYNKINGFGDFDKLSKHNKIILYVGRLISLKGIELFIRLIKDIDDAHFVIVGEGDINLFNHLINKYKIPKNKFTRLDHIDNYKLPWLYKMSKIFILPSYTENFPITLLEAMSMKTPCIASRVGAVEELIENNKNGLIFKPGDYETMKNHVTNLLNNNFLRKKLANDGYKKVLKSLTSKIMAVKTYKIYKGLK